MHCKRFLLGKLAKSHLKYEIVYNLSKLNNKIATVEHFVDEVEVPGLTTDNLNTFNQTNADFEAIREKIKKWKYYEI